MGNFSRDTRVRSGRRALTRFAGRALVAAASLVFAAASGSRCWAAREITIYRDEFGTPYIYATTAEDVCYGMGYSQAEDRLEELLKQYRRATGTMSEAFGPGDQNLQNDYRQRLWRHAEIAREKYPELSAKTRATIEAFLDGVRKYMADHPEKVPAWAPKLEPWMCVALSRYIIWGWPEGEAGGDLKRGGIKPDPIEYHGSNEWLVAPSRTKDKAPIALVDPHLSWYGSFRFYEARLYGGEIEFSGMAIVGLPLPPLGHSRYCSIAMTTGGPDTSDCYVEELNPANRRRYRYDGRWLDMTVRTEVIRVKEGGKVTQKKFEIDETRHGPIVARRENKAYCLKIPYFDQVKVTEQLYRMVTAKNLAEMKQALAMLQLMEQNIMIGTVQGDIYYVRYGRVPIHPAGFDFKRPVPGNTSKSEWQGLHKFENLLQIENPPQGYMQNCNVSPQFMTGDNIAGGKLIDPQAWKDRPDLFNGYWSFEERYDNPLHQRAAMVLQLLTAASQMTVDEAISIAESPAVYGADVWQKRLAAAWAGAAADAKLKSDKHVLELYTLIQNWNRRCDADGTGAIAYLFWKDQFPPNVKAYDKAGFPPPHEVDNPMILTALKKGTEQLLAAFGRLDVRYGDVYRVGRAGTSRDWPVSGGSVDGIATPRAISFDSIDDKKHPHLVGHGGQASTQIVQLTNPPKSWTVLPLGESDDPKSPHYDDQAEKLFSKSRMKPTYFLDKPELLKHLGGKPKTLARE
jgi:acyl-homoserine-lactone acylase